MRLRTRNKGYNDQNNMIMDVTCGSPFREMTALTSMNGSHLMDSKEELTGFSKSAPTVTTAVIEYLNPKLI